MSSPKVYFETRLKRLHSRWRRMPLPFAPATPDRRHVFIITYGRTGSTLLQKVIGSIPGYYMAGENHATMHGIYQAWRNARITRQDFGWAAHPMDHPWHGACAADPDRFAKAMVAAFVDHVLRPPRGARVIGFKEIRHLDILDHLEDYLDFMARYFSPAAFIFNTRSVDEVTRSSWWKGSQRDVVEANVSRFVEIADMLSRRQPDRFVSVDFGEWRDDPEALRPVFALLGEPFDADAIRKLFEVKLTHAASMGG